MSKYVGVIFVYEYAEGTKMQEFNSLKIKITVAIVCDSQIFHIYHYNTIKYYITDGTQSTHLSPTEYTAVENITPISI